MSTIYDIHIYNFNKSHVILGYYYPQFGGLSIIYGHSHVVCIRVCTNNILILNPSGSIVNKRLLFMALLEAKNSIDNKLNNEGNILLQSYFINKD